MPDQPARKWIDPDGTLFDTVELLRDPDGAGVTELADRLGVAERTVHAHLTTLRTRGFAVKRTGEYERGLRAFESHELDRRPVTKINGCYDSQYGRGRPREDANDDTIPGPFGGINQPPPTAPGSGSRGTNSNPTLAGPRPDPGPTRPLVRVPDALRGGYVIS